MVVGGVTLPASKGGGIALLVLGGFTVAIAIALFVRTQLQQQQQQQQPLPQAPSLARAATSPKSTPPPTAPSLARSATSPKSTPPPNLTWANNLTQGKVFRTADPPIVVAATPEMPLEATPQLNAVAPARTYQSAWLTTTPTPTPVAADADKPSFAYTPPNPYPTVNDLTEARERQVCRPQTPEWDRSRRWNGLVEAAQQLKPEPRTVLLNSAAGHECAPSS